MKPGGKTEVTNEKDRNAIASNALEQLEKSSNNGPMARKIVKVRKRYLESKTKSLYRQIFQIVFITRYFVFYR